MPVISIAIQKGGSGKTTTAVNIAAALHRRGKTVLLVDADPQCNLTQSLGVNANPENNLYTEYRKEITGKKSNLQQVIVPTACGMDLVPASPDLSMTEQELVGKFNREQTLRNKMLPSVRDRYDFILIDCPPSFGLLTVNALAASDYLLIPLQAEFLPLMGVQGIFAMLEKMSDLPNLDLEVAGLVLTQYNKRKKLAREIRQSLEQDHGNLVFRTAIRTDIALPLSQKMGRDVFSTAPASHAAEDYTALATELLERMEQPRMVLKELQELEEVE